MSSISEAADASARPQPRNCSDLFWSFTWLALQGFGGVLGQVQAAALESLSLQAEPAPQLATAEADAASAVQVSTADSQPDAKPVRKSAARNKPQE